MESSAGERTGGPRRGGLGRGLGALIPSAPVEAEAGTREVDINAIERNPFQPRLEIDPERLQALADSIAQVGVIQPLVVRNADERGRYVLIAGERRWRAARLAGMTTVPVVVKEATPKQMLEMALIENVVRADLSPLEEAAAYRQLIEEFNMTQQQVAERVGRSRVSVTNTLRLLGAPVQIQEALTAQKISEGHARALLGLPNAMSQVALLQMVIDRGLSVRQTEHEVRRMLAGEKPRAMREPVERDQEEQRLEDRFRAALATDVGFRRGAKGGGTLTVRFASDEELEVLYRRLVDEDIW